MTFYCFFVCLGFIFQFLIPLFRQQLPTFLLFRSEAQQCWIRLHSTSNIVGVTHAPYACITKTYGLYSSHDALHVPNLLGVVASVCTPLPTRTQQLPTLLGVVASVCTPLPTCTQEFPTLLAQHCWELLHPFAHHCQHARSLTGVHPL